MVTLSDSLSDDDAIPLWNFLRSRGSLPDRDHVGNGTPSIKQQQRLSLRIVLCAFAAHTATRSCGTAVLTLRPP